VLRWLDWRGVKRQLADAVSRRNAFIYKLIDGERQKLQLAEDEQGMIGVLLTLQKSEPELYTDTFIAALVAVSLARSIHASIQALPSLMLPLIICLILIFSCLDRRIFLVSGQRQRRRRRNGRWRYC
jgi:hypothetical protein